MKTRLTTQLGFAALALAFAAGTPALAAGKRAAHQGAHPGANNTPSAADHSADQLNAQSLAAIQQGQTFMPSGAAPSGAPPAGGGHGSSM